jgi:hypothetical protein
LVFGRHGKHGQTCGRGLIHVGKISAYCNKWIATYDWLEIIKQAYSIPPPTKKFDLAIINGSPFLRNQKFKLATSEGKLNFIGFFNDNISLRIFPNGQPSSNPKRVVYCSTNLQRRQTRRLPKKKNEEDGLILLNQKLK